MVTQLFPRLADNTFRGRKTALWLLGLVLLFKATMSFNCIFNTRMVVIEADGIPLDTFTATAARTVLVDFATWGMTHFTLCLLGLVVLVRYRSLVPLTYTLLLFDNLGRRAIHHALPMVTTSSTGLFVNLGLLAATALGLVLSLWRRDFRSTGGEGFPMPSSPEVGR